jgi:hypothetical protein
MWIAVYLHTVRTIVAVISGCVGQSGKKRDADCAAQKDKTHVNLRSVFWLVIAKNASNFDWFLAPSAPTQFQP